jgi:hypothetical protein
MSSDHLKLAAVCDHMTSLQAYVPRSARVNAEASSSDQKPQSKGSSGDTSGLSNAHEGSRRRRPPSAGQQGKGGRGRSGKGKGAKSVLPV